MGFFFNRQNGLRPGSMTEDHCGCASCGTDHGQATGGLLSKLARALQHSCDDFFEVGRYLIIGGFIAALMRTAISINTFHQLMSTPWLAILLMMVLAIVLNLCSEADAFIAASFRGVLPGTAQMAFMVLGPMLDIKLVWFISTSVSLLTPSTASDS